MIIQLAGFMFRCHDDNSLHHFQDKKRVSKEALTQLSDKQQQLERYMPD